MLVGDGLRKILGDSAGWRRILLFFGIHLHPIDNWLFDWVRERSGRGVINHGLTALGVQERERYTIESDLFLSSLSSLFFLFVI